MARLEWITGNYSGKLGASVGFEWRGIKAVRTYAKPKQPNTPAQIEHKKRFGILSDLSRQLKTDILPLLFQEQKPLTLANQFVRYNKAFLNLNNNNPVFAVPHTATDNRFAFSINQPSPNGWYLRASGFATPLQGNYIVGLMIVCFPEDKYVGVQQHRSGQADLRFFYPANFSGHRYFWSNLIITDTTIYDIFNSNYGVW